MRVVLSKTAHKQLRLIFSYLEKFWGAKVAQDFYNKFYELIDFIAKHPNAFPESQNKPGLKMASVTKHNKLYYREFPDHIKIYFIWDTRKKSYKR